MSDKTFPVAAGAMPEGEYAIVEILGHRTLVGRVTEVDRFSCKMLQIEPLFAEPMEVLTHFFPQLAAFV